MNSEKNTKRMSFEIDLDLYEKLDNYCYNHGIRKSDLINRAIKREIYIKGIFPNEKIFSLDD